jgi:hypothetical protein
MAPRVARWMSGLATITTSKAAVGPVRTRRRKASRMRRLARFRTTAPPTPRPTASPRRNCDSWFAAATNRNRGPSTRRPPLNVLWKSELVRSRPRRLGPAASSTVGHRREAVAASRRRYACDPWPDGASRRGGRPWSSYERENHASASASGCSAGTCASCA